MAVSVKEIEDALRGMDFAASVVVSPAKDHFDSNYGSSERLIPNLAKQVHSALSQRECSLEKTDQGLVVSVALGSGPKVIEITPGQTQVKLGRMTVKSSTLLYMGDHSDGFQVVTDNRVYIHFLEQSSDNLK